MHLAPAVHHLIDSILGPVGQKNRSGIGITGVHMFNSVFFFISPGQLMFFDGIIEILINGSTDNQPDLAAAIHDQFINIQAVFGILSQGIPMKQLFQVFSGGFINKGIIDFSTRVQRRFRSVDP
jgi:hypothetical protein